MNSARRLELVLRRLAVVLAAVGVVALLLPAGVPEGEVPPAGLGPAPEAPGEPAGALLRDASAPDRVIAANLFSTSRRPPAARYDPYQPAPETYVPPAFDFSAPGTMLETPDPDAVPRLYGTVLGPGGSAALLRLDPATPDAQLYREADLGGAYRVVRIDGQSVELSGPDGRVLLRLPPPPGPTP